ncbi:P-loop containing nucleoside triphosphate hydrolase,DNA helicase Pif1-like [Cinara cedri]|uniref:P-loop containing nucleoside triphosphate hydrolase,DNA helicase Pif1-like n=1 Tax=Cinara cedri TaxID=506608 RepID=A0A5E4MY29_9HEMI|nr:P-loop containing nucleoside triphosphate hydrolase,DNA helicase Pif1-like [Cinara cedri]
MDEIHYLPLIETSYLSRFIILTPKNEYCDEINKRVLDLFPDLSKIYTSVNILIIEDKSKLLQFPAEYLNSLEMNDFPSNELILKEGAIVMLLRNLNTDVGLQNSTKLIVRKVFENSLNLEIITGRHFGQRALYPALIYLHRKLLFHFHLSEKNFL